MRKKRREERQATYGARATAASYYIRLAAKYGKERAGRELAEGLPLRLARV